MTRSRTLRHSTVGVIGIAGMALLPARAPADGIPAFKMEGMTWYVQAGMEWNPAIGPHAFLLPAPAFYDTPQALGFSGASVSTTGSSTHIVAPHPPEAAPATTWTYGFASELPAGFGATERRVRRTRAHPGGPHVDAYVAVAGAVRGTAPGAPVGPNLVIIGGSLGRHTESPPPPAPQPIFGGATLKPRTGQPSPGTLDYPVGQLLTILEAHSAQLTLMVLVTGIPGGSISNVLVRNGPGGPILADLRPMMLLQPMGQYDSALVIQDGVVPVPVVQAMEAGNAYVSVKFPVALHPDGEIVGTITGVPCPADYNGDGFVDGIDYDEFNNDFEAGDMRADYNGDGFVDGIDADEFNNDFENPCP